MSNCKDRRKTVNAIAKIAVYIVIGMSIVYIPAMAGFIDLTPTEVKSYCKTATNNFIDCEEKYNKLDGYYGECRESFENLNEATKILYDKHAEFGIALCNIKNMSFYYTEKKGKLACYDSEQNLYYFQLIPEEE